MSGPRLFYGAADGVIRAAETYLQSGSEASWEALELRCAIVLGVGLGNEWVPSLARMCERFRRERDKRQTPPPKRESV
jgi:hypothetical protein